MNAAVHVVFRSTRSICAFAAGVQPTPDQPAKRYDVAGVAVSLTTVPASTVHDAFAQPLAVTVPPPPDTTAAILNCRTNQAVHVTSTSMRSSVASPAGVQPAPVQPANRC